MHRLAAIVVAAALSVSGPAVLRHVHAYGGHDHGAHQHGPAAHGHAGGHHHTGTPESGPALERCDAGDHAVSAAVAFITAQPVHAPVPDAVGLFALGAPDAAWRPAHAVDDRAHSPPRLTDAPLRAPPA